MSNIFRDHWRSYHQIGLIPLPANGKAPLVRWKEEHIARVEPDDFARWEEQHADSNIWVYLGDDFVVIDPDGPGAEEFVQSLDLPGGPVSLSGNKSRHRWFGAASPLKPVRVQMEDGSLLEIRTGRQGMVVPPSIHPTTKRPYQWAEGKAPWDIDFPDFPLEHYERIKALQEKPVSGIEPGRSESPATGRLDIKRYLDYYRVAYQIKELDGQRILYAFERCLFADQHTTPDNAGDSGIIQGPDGKPGYHCFHNHCASKTWHDARKSISGDEPIAQLYRDDKSLDKEKISPTWERAVMSVRELRTMKFPEKRKIISPWLSEQSIVLVAGWRGVGKTWFAVGLVDAITRGTPFGPWQTITPVSCLYIDGEMAVQDAQERANLLELSANKEPKEQLLVYSDYWRNSLGLPKGNLLDPVWREWIKKSSLSWDIKLVVLDNLSSLCPGIDENSKKEWDPINQWLLDMRFNGISTLALHHTNKEGGQRGTSGREDNLDISILLTQPNDYGPEDGARFIAKFSKARIKHGDLPLISDMEFHLKEVEGRLQWTFGSAKRKNKVEVLRFFSQGISQNEISNMLNISKSQVSKNKAALIADDLLTKKGALTAKGEAILKRVNGQVSF